MLSEEIKQQTEEFLKRGGEIKQIPDGVQTIPPYKTFTWDELVRHHKEKTRKS